jgi:hypothetical protein
MHELQGDAGSMPMVPTPIGVRFCEKSAVFRERFDAPGTYFGIPVPRGSDAPLNGPATVCAVQLLTSTFFTALRGAQSLASMTVSPDSPAKITVRRLGDHGIS